jgi:hypothetical protein
VMCAGWNGSNSPFSLARDNLNLIKSRVVTANKE